MSVLAHLSDGDARIAINCLQLTIEAHKSKLAAGNKSLSSITVEHIKESLQRTHLLYDRKGDLFHSLYDRVKIHMIQLYLIFH